LTVWNIRLKSTSSVSFVVQCLEVKYNKTTPEA
jgi:hypothetical protein